MFRDKRDRNRTKTLAVLAAGSLAVVLSTSLAGAQLGDKITPDAGDGTAGGGQQRTVQRLMEQMTIAPFSPSNTPAIDGAMTAFDPHLALDPAELPFLQTGEMFQITDLYPDGVEAVSPNYAYMAEPADGAFLLVQHEQSTAPLIGGDNASVPAVVQEAMTRLQSIGLAEGELGAPVVRRVMSRGLTNQGELSPARPFAYKVFVSREIAGIPVIGSKVVVTFNTDGQFRRLSGRWPGLALDGHVLTTALGQASVGRRVARHLIGMGESDFVGGIRVDWAYETFPDTNGRVRLRLVAEATLRHADPGQGSKVRQVLIPVN